MSQKLQDGIVIPTPKLIDVNKIKKHPNNIKEHPAEQINNLMKLMKIVGFKDPIVLDKEYEIKAGHGRLEAAINLGMKKVPWIPLEGLTKKQMALFMYMDNHVNESPWILDNVQLLLEDVPLSDLKEFEVGWDEVFDREIEEETEEIPPVPENPKAKLGEMYQLGNHVIMCGNSETDLPKLLQDKKIKLLFTDPPYGVEYVQRKFIDSKVKNKFKPIKNDEKQGDELRNWIKSIFSEIIKFCENTPIYVFAPSMMESLMILQGLMDSGFHLQSQIIWKKNQFVLGRADYHWKHEIIWYGYSSNPHYWCGDRTQDTIWEVKKDPHSSYQHPTQKPTELASRAILNSSKHDDLIFDAFLGSGSTLIVCEQTDRICYGMELDPAYIDVTIQRWENFTGKKAQLITS